MKGKRDAALAPFLEYDFKHLESREVYTIRPRCAIDGDGKLRAVQPDNKFLATARSQCAMMRVINIWASLDCRF